MSLIRLSEARVVQTPAATMRTYASPTTPRPAPVAVWRTDMAPGAAGPVHSVDVDQVVVVVEGALVAELDGAQERIATGDSVLLPAGAERRLVAGDSGAVTVTSSVPGGKAQAAGAEPVPVPWAR
ncbi:cupin domain-containing protein [Blastococcus sp. SYSU D00669]